MISYEDEQHFSKPLFQLNVALYLGNQQRDEAKERASCRCRYTGGRKSPAGLSCHSRQSRHRRRSTW
jgi:hypothetical protein